MPGPGEVEKFLFRWSPTHKSDRAKFKKELEWLIRQAEARGIRRAAKVAEVEWMYGKNSIIRGHDLTSGLGERISKKITELAESVERGE